jgi:phage shock protein A
MTPIELDKIETQLRRNVVHLMNGAIRGELYGEAADAITKLRNKLTRAEAENAALRDELLIAYEHLGAVEADLRQVKRQRAEASAVEAMTEHVGLCKRLAGAESQAIALDQYRTILSNETARADAADHLVEQLWDQIKVLEASLFFWQGQAAALHAEMERRANAASDDLWDAWRDDNHSHG